MLQIDAAGSSECTIMSSMHLLYTLKLDDVITAEWVYGVMNDGLCAGTAFLESGNAHHQVA